MSKPDDIPQDIWHAAILYSGVYAEPAGETLTDLRMDFARAIIAERERCAKVAMGFVRYSYTEGGTALNPFVNAMDIVAAIRHGEGE